MPQNKYYINLWLNKVMSHIMTILTSIFIRNKSNEDKNKILLEMQNNIKWYAKINKRTKNSSKSL